MMWLPKRKLPKALPNNLPLVAIVVSAYNEEEVIAKKIKSTLNTNYPEEKVEIWIGSDGSNDQTNTIVEEFAAQYPNVKSFYFRERTGKPGVLNELIKNIDAEILVLTDADTFFHPDTIPELVKPFSEPEIGGVQADIKSYVSQKDEVARPEKVYNDREFKIKKGESYYGSVIGAYGACYAIRKNLYKAVPPEFYVDDFFIFMKVLEAGYKTVFAPNAVCDMEISGKSDVQFQRKIRISIGNFQNFFRFRAFINPFKNFTSLAFFSHKVIRWMGPFLMVFVLLANGFLLGYDPFFKWLFLGQGIFYCLGILDLLLSDWFMEIKPIRYIRHFVLMNAALFIGFFRFLTFEGDGKWD